MQEAAKPSVNRSRKWIIGGAVVSVLVLILASAVGWMLVMTKAEGIAIGYMQAAGNATQVGRPIPDNIFESGAFRVQAISSKPEDGQMRMVVHVRERWLNTVLYTAERSVVSPGIAR